MGESDRIEQLLAHARTKLRIDNAAAQSSLMAAPYMAPTHGVEGFYQAEYSSHTTEPTAQGRRYTGRSAGLPRVEPVLAPSGAVGATATQGRSSSNHAANVRSTIARSAAVPWSFRLVFSVCLVSTVLVAWRLAGLLTPPTDAGVGVEATHAAFANMLAGHAPQSMDAFRLLPVPAPWYGYAPANPASSLPLYDWVAGGLMALTGAGTWLARALSVLFSLVAGLFLFSTVRRTAGARAGIYAMLLYSVAPISVVLGQQFSPAPLLLAAQSSVIFALVRWRSLANSGVGKGVGIAFAVSLVLGIVAGLVDPGAIFLTLPVAYIAITPNGGTSSAAARRRGLAAWSEAWQHSMYRGKAMAAIGSLLGASGIWWVFNQGSPSGLVLGAGAGGGGIGGAISALLNGVTYVQIVGLTIERLLSVAGLLLLVAGLLQAARPPLQMLFHAWLMSGLLHILLDASRLPAHDDVLLPLILPACALAGIGAAWAGALPARLWLAIHEQKRDREADYAISPHTAWLLDLPEERVYDERPSRPQAQLTLSKSVAQRSRSEGLKMRGAWLLAAGHVAVLTVLALVVAGGAPTVLARLHPTERSIEIEEIGAEVAAALPPAARVVIAGPHAPELFYASGTTGWALTREEFSIAEVQALQREGAAYLLSADQEWLGRQPDYRGLITSFSVLKLSQGYILFDLNKKPADNDRLYFLESGHTLGGPFRIYWERHGGVGKLGYPISEEMVQTNPLDGQSRLVQYFERAVLEFHKEKEGSGDAVMLASVGRWVTRGRTFQPIAPFASRADRWYFADTGHMVKQAFLRYWQQQGGLAMFGYPLSEEMPEINPGDGRVYTVQYFERARFEWHPTFAGTSDEVQLGLIGKQALELSGR